MKPAMIPSVNPKVVPESNPVPSPFDAPGNLGVLIAGELEVESTRFREHFPADEKVGTRCCRYTQQLQHTLAY
jgi:hypothetical protein